MSRKYEPWERRWLYSYVDLLMNEADMTSERFDLWCKAIKSAIEVLRPTPPASLPAGAIKLFDPREIDVSPQEIAYAAAASA